MRRRVYETTRGNFVMRVTRDGEIGGSCQPRTPIGTVLANADDECKPADSIRLCVPIWGRMAPRGTGPLAHKSVDSSDQQVPPKTQNVRRDFS